MWIEELENGKYKCVERYFDPLVGKFRRVSVTMERNTTQTRKAALQALELKIEKKQLYTPTRQITLRALSDAYFQAQQLEVKESTSRRNKGASGTILTILGGDVLVDNLTSGYVKDRLLATGKSAGTLNELLKRVKAMVRWGFRNDLVTNISFLEKLEPFKEAPYKMKIQDKYLEQEEFKKLLDGMSGNSVWKLVTEILVLSGLRIGELLALEKKDIDYKNSLIYVTKTYDYISGKVTTPKTQCSIRDVFMQDELKTACSSLSKFMLQRRLIYRLGPSPLFLFWTDGGHLHYDAYRKYLRETAEKTIGRKITPHALRHTHASFLLAQGIDIETIQRRLGHENSRVTRDIYLHITEELKKRDNAAIGKVKIL